MSVRKVASYDEAVPMMERAQVLLEEMKGRGLKADEAFEALVCAVQLMHSIAREETPTFAREMVWLLRGALEEMEQS